MKSNDDYKRVGENKVIMSDKDFLNKHQQVRNIYLQTFCVLYKTSLRYILLQYDPNIVDDVESKI